MGTLSLLTSCVKYMLFLFNLLFVISGIILIVVGAAVAGEYKLYQPILLDSAYTSVPALLIAIGVIIFIISFFGCCGAIKESYFMTLTFAILLILVFIMELAGGISGYVLRGRTYEVLEKALNKSMTEYTTDIKGSAFVWDTMQRDFECCGINGMKNWEEVDPTSFHDGILPMSCCKPKDGTIEPKNCTITSKDFVFEKGCLDLMSDFIRSHAGSLGAAGLLIGIIQGVGIIFACHLAKRTKFETS